VLLLLAAVSRVLWVEVLPRPLCENKLPIPWTQRVPRQKRVGSERTTQTARKSSAAANRVEAISIMAKVKPTKPAMAAEYKDMDFESEENDTVMDESRDPLEESGCTRTDDSEEEIEDTVAEDMARFEESFKGITKRYRLINRIGEGESHPAAFNRCIGFVAHTSIRNLFDCLQSRGPSL